MNELDRAVARNRDDFFSRRVPIDRVAEVFFFSTFRVT